LPQIYVMAADGTDQQLFAPFDYGVTGSSNAPEWSPDGQSVAFHRDVAGTLQVFVLDVRTRTVRVLTSVGRNEDPTWAPDSRPLAFVRDPLRLLRQLDNVARRNDARGRFEEEERLFRYLVAEPLLQQSGDRLPACSPRIPEPSPAIP
jgi:Tol biopolymer transport system component